MFKAIRNLFSRKKPEKAKVASSRDKMWHKPVDRSLLTNTNQPALRTHIDSLNRYNEPESLLQQIILIDALSDASSSHSSVGSSYRSHGSDTPSHTHSTSSYDSGWSHSSYDSGSSSSYDSGSSSSYDSGSSSSFD